MPGSRRMGAWYIALLVVVISKISPISSSIEDALVTARDQRKSEPDCSKLCRENLTLTNERFSRVWAVPNSTTSRARLFLCWRETEIYSDFCKNGQRRKYELTFKSLSPVLLQVLKINDFLVLTENGSLVQTVSEEKKLQTKKYHVMDFSVKQYENVCWQVGDCSFAGNSDNGNETLPDVPGASVSEKEGEGKKAPLGTTYDRRLTWAGLVGFVVALVLLLLCIEIRFRIVWRRLKRLYEDFRSGEESSISWFSGATTTTRASSSLPPPSGGSCANPSFSKPRLLGGSLHEKGHGGDVGARPPFPRFTLPGIQRNLKEEESDEEHEYDEVDSEYLRNILKNPLHLGPFDDNKKDMANGGTFPLGQHVSINPIYSMGDAREGTQEEATEEKVSQLASSNPSIDEHDSINPIYAELRGTLTPEEVPQEEEASQLHSSRENESAQETCLELENRDDLPGPLDRNGGPEEQTPVQVMHRAVQNIPRRPNATMSLPPAIGDRVPFICLDGS